VLKDTDFITIICPHCGNETRETVARLKEVASFDHTCGGRIYTDINEVIEFAREQSANTLAKLRLRVSHP